MGCQPVTVNGTGFGSKRIKMKLLIFLSIGFISCSKGNYEQNPTCQRVFMFADFYNSDTIYTHTIEMHPFKPYENYLCNDELVQWRNQPTPLSGCPADGFSKYRYSVGNEITKPIIFKQ